MRTTDGASPLGLVLAGLTGLVESDVVDMTDQQVRDEVALAAVAGRGRVSAEHLAKVGQLADRVGLAAVRDFDDIRRGEFRGESGREIVFSRLGSMLYLRGRLDAEGGCRADDSR